MDNRKFDIVSEGEEDLELAVRLVWGQAKGGKVTHYYIGGQAIKGDALVPTLVLLWHDEGNATPLPFPLDMNSAFWFIKSWLETVDYGCEPDHDGDNGRGWRIYNDNWGHVGKFHYGVLGVQPVWAMYGK